MDGALLPPFCLTWDKTVVEVMKIMLPSFRRSPGGGDGNPLQYSCLGKPMDRGTWWTMVYVVAKSQTQLSGWALTARNWFTLLYGRNEHNIVNQLHANKMNLKYVFFCFCFSHGSKWIGFIKEKENTKLSAQTLRVGKESPKNMLLKKGKKSFSGVILY